MFHNTFAHSHKYRLLKTFCLCLFLLLVWSNLKYFKDTLKTLSKRFKTTHHIHHTNHTHRTQYKAFKRHPQQYYRPLDCGENNADADDYGQEHIVTIPNVKLMLKSQKPLVISNKLLTFAL